MSSLLKKRHDANESLLSLKKKHSQLEEQIDKYNDISVGKNSYIENLRDEIEKLENKISELKNSDEYLTKFEQLAREKFDTIIKDHRLMLALALGAAIESIRRDPDKRMLIDNETVSQTHQDKLLDLSEEFFEKILRQLIDGTMQFDIASDITLDILT